LDVTLIVILFTFVILILGLPLIFLLIVVRKIFDRFKSLEDMIKEIKQHKI